MNYKTETSDKFEKQAKKLTKKYPSLDRELAELFEELEINPTMV